MTIEKESKTKKATKDTKTGRPTVLTDDKLKEVGKLANVGLTIQQIADYLEVSKRTCERNEDFCRIYKKELASIGKYTRVSLLGLMKNGDVASTIYLDKIINKSTTGQEDRLFELKVRELDQRAGEHKDRMEIVRGDKTRPIMVVSDLTKGDF